MALREEEFERLQVSVSMFFKSSPCSTGLTFLSHFPIHLQTQLLELKTSNYSLAESNSRKDSTITLLQSRSDELERELAKMQTLAKMNPLSYAKSMANRKDAKKEENLNQLRAELDALTVKMESQEEEFKRTNEFLKQEITDLLVDNQKLRDYVEETDTGPEFLKSLLNQSASKSTPSSRSSMSPVKSRQSDECDIGRSSSFGQASQFTLIAEREKLNNQLLDLQHELKMVKSERDTLSSSLASMTVEHQSLKGKSSETLILAEERKKTIDEMKAHMDETRHQHEAAIIQMRKDNETVLHQLNERISCLSQVEGEWSKVVSEKDKLETQLNQASQDLDDQKMEKEYLLTRVDQLRNEHEGRILLMQETHASEMQQMQDKLDQSREEINQLKRSAADSIEDRKIHEKKALKMMKEFKRNLDQEKARANQLQQKLHDFLNTQNPEILHPDFDRRHELDANTYNDDGTHGRSPHRYHPSSSGHLMTTASSSSTSTPLKFPAAAAANCNPAAAAAAPPADAYGSRSSVNSEAGSQHQSDEKLNDTSSAGSWSFMSNSRNGGNGNGIDKIGISSGSPGPGAGTAASSDHSNGSNDFATTCSSGSTTAAIITGTTATASCSSDSASAAAASRQQLHHLSSPASSSRNRQTAGGGGECGTPASPGVGNNGNVILLIEELECENRQLVARISDLKQENWQLEERVNQLLAQVEDLKIDNRNKGLIIEFYCMGEQRDRSSSSTSITSNSAASSAHSHHHHHHQPSRDKMTVRKVVDFIKDRGDENLKEINRKLQRLLEETLTKNMFLQQDLENLSHEVVRLSKESVQSNNTGTTASSTSK